MVILEASAENRDHERYGWTDDDRKTLVPEVDRLAPAGAPDRPV